MITSCLIFLASLTPNAENSEYYEEFEIIRRVHECTEIIPSSMIEHADELVEYFEPSNLYTAMRISWCESRGKEEAYRKEDNDSGLFQFIPNTWKWVRQYAPFDLPEWDEFWLVVNDKPVVTVIDFFKYDLKYDEYDIVEVKKAQFIADFNVMAAAYLSQGMHNYSPYWKDWNSSKWCWESPTYFEKRWRQEGY